MLLDEYTKEQFESFIPEIDTATADDLYEYFSYREPIANFQHFLKQTSRTYGDQYVRMLRDESVQYDAMVNEYIERLTKGKTTDTTETKGTTNETTGATGKITNSGTNTTIRDTSGNTTETPNTTTVEDVNSSTSGTRNNTGTQTNASNSNNKEDTSETNSNRQLNKTNPMSITYDETMGTGFAGEYVGMPTKLPWATADAQAQGDHTGVSSNTTQGHEDTTRTDDLAEATSQSGTGKTTTAVSGTNSTDVKGKETTTENLGSGSTSTTDATKTGSNSGSTTSNGTTRTTDQYTGRHGASAAELLQKSRDYILLMKSFQWLCEKFNPCFEWLVEV